MIYKIQRLFSKGNKDNTPQENTSQPKPERKHVQYKTADDAIAGSKKKKLKGYKKLAGNTAYIDEETGKRITAETLEHEYETEIKNAKTLKQLEKEAKREENIDKAKQKVKNAADKTKTWAKKNKKGLIIGGSVLAAGTGAAVVGSKINKKNKENKIKKDVRGY